MIGTPSSASSIENVYRVLELLEIVFSANCAAVEGLADINGHRRKLVGEGKSVSWGGTRTKGGGRECELIKNVLPGVIF